MIRFFLLYIFFSLTFFASFAQEKRDIRIGGYDQQPPYVTINEDGQPDGFAVELIKAIFHEMGYDYDIKLYSHKDDSIGVLLQQYDFLLSQDFLNNDDQQLYFSNPYNRFSFDVLCRKGVDYTGPRDLFGKKVIVRRNGLAYQKLQLIGLENLKDIIYVDNTYAGLKMLTERIADYMLCDATTSAILTPQKNLDNIITYNSGFSDIKTSFVSPDLALMAAVNRSMQELKDNGTYQRLYDKWLGIKKPFLNSEQLYLVILIFVIVVIVLAVLYFLMRLRVYNATKEILASKNKIEGLNSLINMLNQKSGTDIFMCDETTREIFQLKGGKFELTPITFNYSFNTIHPDDRLAFLHKRRDLLNGNIKELSSTIRFFNAEQGKFCHYKYVISPVEYDVNGRVIKYIYSLHNETQQQELIDEQDKVIKTLNMAMSSAKLVRWQYDFASDILKYTDVNLDEYALKSDMAKLLTHRDYRKDLSYVFEHLMDTYDPVSIISWQKYACDEDYKPYEVCCNISRDKEGNPVSLFGIARDISEVHTFQQQLKEKIKLLETIKDNMPVGMFIFDKSGVLIDMNKTQNSFTGIYRNRILQGNVNLFEMEFMRSIANDCIEQRGVLQGEVNYKDIHKQFGHVIDDCKPHGELFDVRCTPIIGDSGEIEGFITIYNDITEQEKDKREIKYLQNKLKLSLDAEDMTAWRYDYTTERFATIHAQNADAELKTLTESIERTHPDDVNILLDVMERLKKGELAKARCEVRIDLGHGMRWYRFSLAPEYDGGEVAFINGTRKDVTEEVLNRQALTIAKQKAEESERLKMAFLANMSHEIRTPLNSIIGFSDLLQHTDDPEERSEYMNIINTNNELLLRLINDILDLSKIESGQNDIDLTSFDLVATYNQIVASFSARLNDGTVKLIDANRMSQCMVTMDNKKLVQVFNNFMSNALKYTKEGTITSGMDYTDNGVKIWVTDTGIGIAEKDHKYVFQRFHKFDNFAQGTGLGLAICKALVEMLGGKIGFESAKGKGSMFWAWFPCELSSVAMAKEEKQDAIESQTHKKDELKQQSTIIKRILVAEDNESNFMLLKALLADCELAHAHDGEQAIELSRNCDFDLILMDMKMPKVNGLEATRTIRQFDRKTPIYALTANVFDSERDAIFEAGCDRLIAKPLNREDFITIIHS